MKLSEFIYIVEGEVRTGLVQDSSMQVLIVTEDGKAHEPQTCVGDGQVLIVNVVEARP